MIQLGQPVGAIITGENIGFQLIATERQGDVATGKLMIKVTTAGFRPPLRRASFLRDSGRPEWAQVSVREPPGSRGRALGAGRPRNPLDR